MINFFSSGVKYILLKILGKNIKMNGIPVVDIRAEIKAHSGEIMLGHKMSTRSNVHIRAFDGGNISIGDLVFFNYNCVVSSRGKIVIGDGTIFGPNVSIFDHNHKFGYDGVEDNMSIGSIRIGKNCWIGSGSTILKGADIGDCCVIGAGTIVSESIPPHSIVTMDRQLQIRTIEKR